jgi:hypothetical protein
MSIIALLGVLALFFCVLHILKPQLPLWIAVLILVLAFLLLHAGVLR